MQAEDDQALVEAADHQARDRVVEVQNRVDERGDATRDEHDRRAEDQQDEGGDHEDLNERAEDGADDRGQDLLEPGLDLGGQPSAYDDGEDRGRVGVALRQGDRDPEEVGVEDGLPELCDDVVGLGVLHRAVVLSDLDDMVGVGQGHDGGVAQHAADNGHDDGVRPQAPSGGEADDDRQEVEHRRAHGVDNLVGVRGLGHHLELDEQGQQPLEDSGGGQHPDDRDHGSGDDADERGEAELDPSYERGGPLDLLDLALRIALRGAGQLLDDGLVDVLDLGADDDLVLAAGLGHVDDALGAGNGGVVGDRLVLEVEAHAGDAVEHRADVVGAADVLDDVGGGGVEAGQPVGALAVTRGLRDR